MTKKMTERNTKADILKAYEESLEKLKVKEEAIHSPEKIANETAVKSTIKKVESVKPSTIENAVDKIQKDISKINADLEVYSDIKNAISIKQAELDELFNIKVNAYSLTALINATAEAKEAKELEIANRESEIAEKEALVKEQRAKTDAERKEFWENERKNLAEGLAREKTEWDYDFSRKKMLDTNSLNDELEALRKEQQMKLEADAEALRIREGIIADREENMDNMETKLALLEQRLVEIEEEVTAKVTDKLKTASGFETRYIKRDFESKLELVEQKLETALKEVENERAEKMSLSSKLDEAYTKLENLATKTVEGASNSKMISSLEGLVKQNQNGK